MIDLFYFSGLPVAVLGLGTSGLSAARALAASKADVRAWDDDPARREAAAREGIPVVDLAACDWRELTTLVISPGIPHRHPAPHPVAALAREHNCEIVSDIELLARAQRNASYVGITGTNGKSTTTALIGHILETAGREVAVGGNLGTPALALEALESGGLYVLEMSSYQLEITVSITFDVAVLLNISADHLERHGGFEGYVAAKRLIFHRQTKPRSAIVGIDDETSRGIWEALRDADEQLVVPISGCRAAPGGVYVEDGVLVDDSDGQAVRALDLRPIPSLPGVHNWQNAAAAYAACKALNVPPPVITACMQSFPGLAHRQELVAVIDGVSYVNDSKATNADAAAKALACYGRIFWIAGGQPKEGSLEALAPSYGNIAQAFLIGEAADGFAQALDGKVTVRVCGDLETAVRAAQAAANQAADAGETGAVVLLSPAAASFDQYRNFEARGEHFRTLVDALPGQHADLGPGGAVLP